MKNLNRRSFLKGAVVAAAAATAGVALTAFGPSAAAVTKEMGISIPFSVGTAGEHSDQIGLVTRMLHRSAAQNLPPGTRYEIRRPIPTDFGWHQTLAWYHHPDMASQPETTDWPRFREGGPNAGDLLVSQHVTTGKVPLATHSVPRGTPRSKTYHESVDARLLREGWSKPL